MNKKNIKNNESQLHVVDDIDVWQVLRNIASQEKEDMPFFLVNINDIVTKHKLWTTMLPRVKPYYAVKCNHNHIVLQTLNALGVGFDCASKIEISNVLAAGSDASRILFTHPAKPLSHINYAKSVGIKTLTFDNEYELYKLHKLYPDANLVIRIRSDAKDSQINLGLKFGCDPIKEAPELLRVAKSLNLNVIGVSFHVGWGCKEPHAYYRAIKCSRYVFDNAKTLGYNFTFLDIGGGYPGVYSSLFDEMCIKINTAIEQFFPGPEVEIVSEPGQFYSKSAYHLATNIHSIKEIKQDDNTIKRMYYLNDGVYGSINCVLNEQRIMKPMPLNKSSSPRRYLSTIWGASCDSSDVVLDNTVLPEMHPGEWIVFDNMGAYSIEIASTFNGFPLAKLHYVITKDLWVAMKYSLSLCEDNIEESKKYILN